jgi:hypothetical protein
MDITNNISDEVIFSKVSELMTKLKQNQQLQELAEKNGLNIKNTVKLTDDSIDNIAVSVVSLLLAKRANDSRYKTLVCTGVKKRSLKTDIINTYKNQANQLISRYKENIAEDTLSV